ncbi:tail fiber assembly protein [Providencia sp. PROV033]|uniref:tail fiber assembly protein n=1 Tax=Providencia sp. PROV033 TaxID=2949765 RepID=UPI002349960F|nr:tail fiber assembly protein [Providencia sp. PROV033]
MKMHYYKDVDNNRVHAYSDEQLAQVNRCTELEALLVDKELELTESQKKLNEKQDKFNAAYIECESANNGDTAESEVEVLRQKLIYAQEELNDELISFKKAESDYIQLKFEYDSIFHVFFDIRDKLKEFKKMSAKELEAHLNPPVSKEQLIAEAGQQKQSLLVEANNVLVPLQDAVDLGMATDEEIALLKEWKKYRVLLNRIDTSTSPDIDWPQKP